MQISHEVLVKAAELARLHTTKTLYIGVEIHLLGIRIRGVERKFLPKLLSFEQVVAWEKLESPVAGFILEQTFAKIAQALKEGPANDSKPPTVGAAARPA